MIIIIYIIVANYFSKHGRQDTLYTVPKPPSPSLLEKEKLSVAATIVLSEKQITSVPLSFIASTSACPSINDISLFPEP